MTWISFVDRSVLFRVSQRQTPCTPPHGLFSIMLLRWTHSVLCFLAVVLHAHASCPVALNASFFANAVTPCTAPSQTALCTQCLPAVVTPFIIAGVSASDAVTLGACITANAASVLAAGVSYQTLANLSACQTPSPPSLSSSPPLVQSPPPAVTCPVTAAQNFSAAAAPCSSVSNACTTCITALVTPFIMTGTVSPTDSAILSVCIQAQVGAILGAGVSPAILGALSSCGAAQPPPNAQPPPSMPPPVAYSPPPSSASCPVTASQNFTAAVAPCASVANACTTCVTALAMPFVLAGVSPSNTAVIGACLTAQSQAMISAGVPIATLAALSSCGAPAPLPPPASSPPPPPQLVSPPPPVSVPAASCPITQQLSFTAAVAPCANPSLVCTSCVTALAGPIVLSGVSPSNVPVITACITSQMGNILAAGVSMTAVLALSSCATSPPPALMQPPMAASTPAILSPTTPLASSPPLAVQATCPFTTPLNYAAAVTPCAVPANLCGSCLTAIATPIVLAGVSPSNTAVIGACITAQFAAITSAGVTTAVLLGLSACGAAAPPPAAASPVVITPSPPPLSPPPAVVTVSATITLSGLTTAQFNSNMQTAFIATLASQQNISAGSINITSVTAASGSGRHLMQSGINVAFTVTATSSTAANTISSGITSIASGSGAAAFTAALSTAGVSTTGVALAVAPAVNASGSTTASASPPPPATVVPILPCSVGSPIDFTAAAQPCKNSSNACSTCLQALAAAVIHTGTCMIMSSI